MEASLTFVNLELGVNELLGHLTATLDLRQVLVQSVEKVIFRTVGVNHEVLLRNRLMGNLCFKNGIVLF